MTSKLEKALRQGTRLSDPEDVANAIRWAHTSDPQPQLRGLKQLHTQTEGRFRAWLQQRAHDNLSCFVEFMDMTEPPAEHHEFFCSEFEAIERGEIPRAAYSCPPGHAKTKFLSRYGPAWYLGRNRRHIWLQGAHSQDFVEKQIGQHVRNILMEPAYSEVFDDISIDPRSTAAGAWDLLGERGGYRGKGVGQGISGFRGNIGAIDDPIGKRKDVESPTFRADQKRWLMTDFNKRLLPNAPLYIISTRWHEDDMIGFCEQLNKEGKGIPWRIINLNGIIENEEEMEADILGRDIGEVLWPSYYTYAIVMNDKATMPTEDWFALIKGTPRDIEGNVVKKAWIPRYDVIPADKYDGNMRCIEKRIRRVTVSVDCAEKATVRSKYTAVGVWIETVEGHHYLKEVRRKRVEFPDMIRLIEDTARDHNATAILVEDAGNGTPYIQTRQGKAPAPIIRIPKPGKDSKAFRFDEVTPMHEGGEVWWPKRAVWLPDYESEILGFPSGAFTDQVDMTSQYLTWARKKRKYGTRKLGGALNAH